MANVFKRQVVQTEEGQVPTMVEVDGFGFMSLPEYDAFCRQRLEPIRVLHPAEWSDSISTASKEVVTTVLAEKDQTLEQLTSASPEPAMLDVDNVPLEIDGKTAE